MNLREGDILDRKIVELGGREFEAYLQVVSNYNKTLFIKSKLKPLSRKAKYIKLLAEDKDLESVKDEVKE